MEPKKLQPQRWYLISAASEGTLRIKTDGADIPVAYKPGQTMFFAVTDAYECEDDSVIISGPFDGAPATGLGGGETPSVLVRHFATPAGTGNTWWNFAVLAPRYFEAGLLYGVSIRARNSQSGLHEIWLGVFERPENGSEDPSTWTFIGASNESCVQQNGEMTEWSFNGLPLSGRELAFCGMAERTTGWNMDTQVGAWAAPRGAADSVSRLGGRAAVLQYVAEMQLTVREAVTDALTLHIGDAVRHITAEERARWDGKADASALSNKVNSGTFNAHTSNATAHLTTEEHTGLTALLEKKDALLGLLDAPAEQ